MSTELKGYNLVIILSTFLLSLTAFGYVNSWGVYQEYYTKNKYGNEFEISFIGSLSAGLEFGFSLLPASIISNFKLVLFSGIILCTISLLLASWSTKLWELYLTQGIIFGIGASFIFVSISVITPLWFTKNRGLAIGIGASGSGIGGLIYSILTKKHINLKPMKEKGFILWLFCVTFFAFAFMNPQNFISSYSTSIGLTSDNGALFISIISISNAIGRILIGLFSDKFGHINTCIIFF